MNLVRIATVAMLTIALATAAVPGAEAKELIQCNVQGINVWDNIDEVGSCGTDQGRAIGQFTTDLLCAAIC